MKIPALLILLCPFPALAAVTIDGDFSDWSGIATLATDPADATGNPITDFLTVKLHSDSSSLYVYYQTAGNIDFGANAWRYNVLFDTDRSPTTGARLFATSAGGFEFLLQGGTLHSHDDPGDGWNWASLGFVTYSYSANEAEFSIGLDQLGLSPGDSLDLIFFGDNDQGDLVPDNYGAESLSYTTIPEPAHGLLLGLGALFLANRRRR